MNSECDNFYKFFVEFNYFSEEQVEKIEVLLTSACASVTFN